MAKMDLNTSRLWLVTLGVLASCLVGFTHGHSWKWSTDSLTLFSAKLMDAQLKNRVNLAISPASIQMAVRSLTQGVKEGSEAESELLEVLYGRSIKDDEENFCQEANKSIVKLTGSKDALNYWQVILYGGDGKFNSKFSKKVKEEFQTEVLKVTKDSEDENRKEINQVSRDFGFTRDLVKDADVKTPFDLRLLSSAAAHSDWLKKVDVVDIEDILFYNEGAKDDKILKGKALRLKDYPIKRLEKDTGEEADDSSPSVSIDSRHRILELPLKNNLSFIIFEPLDKGEGNELQKLEEELFAVRDKTDTYFADALKLLDEAETQDVEYLQIPQFRFDNEVADMTDTLKEMGLKKIFEKKSLPNVLEGRRCPKVDWIRAESFIELNCKGMGPSKDDCSKTVTDDKDDNSEDFDDDDDEGEKKKPGAPLIIKHPFMFVVRYFEMTVVIGRITKLTERINACDDRDDRDDRDES